MAWTKSSVGDERVVRPPRNDLAALLVYGLVGAAGATLLIAALEMVGVLTSPPLDAADGGDASRNERSCPLSASPAACDACMLDKCAASCGACAANPSCLRLFACLLDCDDAGCEGQCTRREPEGRADLAAFVGEHGCLPQKCGASCP